ncbi:ABC transporter substrate-binding protein [Jeotgalibaca sp. A122]|uniref:ABC transporter substrate-binding protein n=1 Tax=Jeotgalibaca sp. A122 TaxID=3457322 RepID=UPI003FCFB5CC
MLRSKKNIGKWLALSSAGVLLAACGGGNTAESGQAAGTAVDVTALPEAGDFEETVELHLSGSFTQGNIEDDNWVQQKLEEKFNVDIENTKVDTWNKDEASIMIASGDLPDAFAFTGGSMTPKEFFENGLTRSIPREMIEKYMPRYTAMLNENENGLGWELNKVPGTEDEYFALTGHQTHTKGIIWAPTLRLDWMEELGLELPDDMEPIGDSDGYERIYWTNQSYSLEDLEKILTAFTYEDPDGNGKDDTYGLLPYNSDLNWATTLFGAHGVAPSYNLMENDELKMPVISEGYKETLNLLADWNEKGLIDPEWTTLTAQTAWEKYQTGSAGYFIAQRTYLAQEDWTKGRAPHNVIAADPDAKLLAFAPEVGPDGTQGEQSYMPVTLFGDSMQISADVTDEELARYLQMFDYINHDPEPWVNYGNPGEHSDWQGEEGNSALIVRPEFPREEGDMGFWAYSFRSYPNERGVYLSHPKTTELNELFFTKPEVVDEMAIRPYRHDLFDETEYADLNGRYGAQLTTIADEFRMNGITGSIDIEAEWDAYVERYLENGGSQLLEELEKAPLVEDLLSGEVE